MFENLQHQREKQIEVEKKLAIINEKNLKLSKRNKNAFTYTVTATAIGLILGVLISKN